MLRRVSLGLLLLLAACAMPDDGGSDLAGSQWTLVRIDGEPPAAPDRARLSFDRERLAASAGCNSLGGPWRVEGLRLIAGPLVQTEMYCEGPVWEQERALSALLSAGPVVTREGDTLTLVSSRAADPGRRLKRSQSPATKAVTFHSPFWRSAIRR